MHMKMWRLKSGISVLRGAATGFKRACENRHIFWFQHRLLERVGSDHGSDLLHAQRRPLELMGLAERGVGSLGQLVELPLDVAEIALEILLDGAGVAIPFGAQIGARRE